MGAKSGASNPVGFATRRSPPRSSGWSDRVSRTGPSRRTSRPNARDSAAPAGSRQRWASIVTHWEVVAFAAVGLIFAVMVARPFEVVLGVRDAGVYANIGFAIVRTGGIVQNDVDRRRAAEVAPGEAGDQEGQHRDHQAEGQHVEHRGDVDERHRGAADRGQRHGAHARLRHLLDESERAQRPK